MRVGRAFTGGRAQLPLRYIPGPNIYWRKLSDWAPVLAADQKYAGRLGNQLNYRNELYSYDGKPAPSFYGYASTGAGGNALGFAATINFTTFTTPLYVARQTDPQVKVYMVKEEKPTGEVLAPEETLRTDPFSLKIVEEWLEKVRMPDPAKVLFGQLQSQGTDAEFALWDPVAKRYLDMHRLGKFKEGELAGQWKIGFGGGYDTTTWDGLPIASHGGTSASRLSIGALMISHQDLIEVLRGGKIKHMLGISIPVIEGNTIAPGVSHDGPFENATVEWTNSKAEKVANPAHGAVDQVSEGMCFCFPAASSAAEFGLVAGTLEWAIYEAIREYGLIVRDFAGAAALQLEDYHALGSPYCYAKVNPFGGSPLARFEAVNAVVPGTWTDPTLPIITQDITGTTGSVFKLWQKTAGQLQQIEPFSS
jgi:hypothetical protein